MSQSDATIADHEGSEGGVDECRRRVGDRARRFGEQRLGGGTTPSRPIEAFLRCCDLKCSRISTKSVLTLSLHDPDDRSVMCNADGITLEFQSSFVRMEINAASLTRVCESM